jgi:glycosyltransferase involved in cell wall biosynthesis
VRIIETAGVYFPDSTGGTEVYVSFLAKELRAHGIDCAIAAPTRLPEASRYLHEGVEVFRYPVPERLHRSERQGREPPRQFGVFEAWLRQQRADVYHQHSWTPGCGLWHFEAAKGLGLKTVITVHLPNNICMRGTMLYEGREVCDGKIVPEKCASCWLQSKGIPASVARRMAKLPEGFLRLQPLPLFGPALAAHGVAANRKKQLQDIMTVVADRVVTPCNWLYEALRANGVPPRKLFLNRQGVGHWAQAKPVSRPKKTTDVLRLGFLGRWDPVKGVHVLVEAFKRLPADLSVELTICAAGGDNATKKYIDVVQRSAARDRRIRFLPLMPHQDVGAFLAGIDVLAVPSQCMETGPLVLLEAFAAGTPVIGSDLGGIKELISHERDGLLVPYAEVSAWTAAMMRLATDRVLLEQLRHGIGSVRTMSDVARDMTMLYRDLFVRRPYDAPK